MMAALRRTVRGPERQPVRQSLETQAHRPSATVDKEEEKHVSRASQKSVVIMKVKDAVRSPAWRAVRTLETGPYQLQTPPGHVPRKIARPMTSWYRSARKG